MCDENIEKMDELKQAYEKISIPDSAKRSILKGIETAKREKKKSGMIKFIKNTGIGTAAAVMAMTVMVNTNQTIANAMEQIPVIGALAKVVTFRTYESQSKGAEANIVIPKVWQEEGVESTLAVNKAIEEYADAFIRQFEEEVTKGQGENHYQLTSNYEVVTDDAHYLSIRINTTEVMASGAQYVKIFTVDKRTGELVTLKMMFSDKNNFIDNVSNNIKQQMKQQMEADSSKIYFLDSEIPESDFNGITGEESYYLNMQGQLVIVFDEYQVAPGYMGVVEFTIPEELTN